MSAVRAIADGILSSGMSAVLPTPCPCGEQRQYLGLGESASAARSLVVHMIGEHDVIVRPLQGEVDAALDKLRMVNVARIERMQALRIHRVVRQPHLRYIPRARVGRGEGDHVPPAPSPARC